MTPEWLLRNEEYSPPIDRDAFIDKSIRSFLRLLSRIRMQGGRADGKVRINPGVRLGSTLLLVLLLSLSHSFFFVASAGALLLALVSLYPGELILRVLKTSLPVTAFTFFVLLPSAIGGNAPSLIMITTKVFVTVAAGKLLVVTADWESILGALRVFFVPQLLILVLDITIKYLVLLGELSLHMLYALKLRSVGRNGSKAASLSGIAGTLFLRSREMAEEMYAAMECRCFTGSYVIGRAAQLSLADLIPVIFDALLLLVFFAAGA